MNDLNPKSFLTMAQKRLRAAEVLMSSYGEDVERSIGSELGRASEMLLKSIILSCGVLPARIHRISKLFDEAETLSSTDLGEFYPLVKLEDYLGSGCYLESEVLITESDFNDLIALAYNLVSLVKKRIDQGIKSED